jgi:hypothetical protein
MKRRLCLHSSPKRSNNSGITSRSVIEIEHIAGIRLTATAYKGWKISRKSLMRDLDLRGSGS